MRVQLTDGGSERNFYRVYNGDRTVIHMEYSDEREENKFYYDIAVFLKTLGINVPEIYHKEDGFIILEDLGNTHLYNLVITNLEEEVIRYYYKVIEQLIILHQTGEKFYKKAPFKISKGFDYSLYRWESNYFLENLVNGYFNLDIDLESEFHLIADTLSKVNGQGLIHRDCQSKNIMIKNEEPYFIDFQGMRYGLPEYDLASLLEDPYVNLSKGTKCRLIDYYYRCRECRDYGYVNIIYNYCAIQRLMQALGAYAFLGLKKGKREFLQYIPNGIKRLNLILENIKGLDGLKELVSGIVVKISA